MSDSNEINEAQVLDWMSRLTEKQFVEFFYRATKSRIIQTYSWSQEHYALALAIKEEHEPWDIELLGTHDKNHYPSGWKNDALFELGGECPECNHNLSSWAQYSLCPVCGGKVTLG